MTFFLLQTGDYLLLESGYKLILQEGCSPYPPIAPALLLQDGFYLRLEDCGHLLIGDVVPPIPPRHQQKGRGNTRRGYVVNEVMEDEDLKLILALWANLR